MDGNEEIAATPRRSKKPAIIAAIVVAIVAGLFGLWKLFGTGLPRIEPADLHRARERWDAAAIGDYRMTVVVRGRQTAEMHVEVRGGKPIGLTNGDVPLTRESAWRAWTVEGMLDVLETDFDNAEQAQDKFGVEPAAVVLRCEFDAQFGYPRRYLHQVYGRHQDLEWEVTEFMSLEATAR